MFSVQGRLCVFVSFLSVVVATSTTTSTTTEGTLYRKTRGDRYYYSRYSSNYGGGPGSWDTHHGVSSFNWDSEREPLPERPCSRCGSSTARGDSGDAGYRGNGYDNLSPEWQERMKQQWNKASGWNKGGGGGWTSGGGGGSGGGWNSGGGGPPAKWSSGGGGNGWNGGGGGGGGGWNSGGGWNKGPPGDGGWNSRPGSWQGSIKPIDPAWNDPQWNKGGSPGWNKGYESNQGWGSGTPGWSGKGYPPRRSWDDSSNVVGGGGWDVGSHHGHGHDPSQRGDSGHGGYWATSGHASSWDRGGSYPSSSWSSRPSGWGGSNQGPSSWGGGYDRPRDWSGGYSKGMSSWNGGYNKGGSGSWGGGYDKGYASGWDYNRPMPPKSWDKPRDPGWDSGPEDPISAQWRSDLRPKDPSWGNPPRYPSWDSGSSWNQGPSGGHDYGAHNKPTGPGWDYGRPQGPPEQSGWDRPPSGSSWSSGPRGPPGGWSSHGEGGSHGSGGVYYHDDCNHKGHYPSDPHRREEAGGEHYPIDPRRGTYPLEGHHGRDPYRDRGSYPSSSEYDNRQRPQFNGHSGVGADLEIRPGYIYERPTTIVNKNMTKQGDHDQDAATATISPTTTTL